MNFYTYDLVANLSNVDVAFYIYYSENAKSSLKYLSAA